MLHTYHDDIQSRLLLRSRHGCVLWWKFSASDLNTKTPMQMALYTRVELIMTKQDLLISASLSRTGADQDIDAYAYRHWHLTRVQ